MRKGYWEPVVGKYNPKFDYVEVNHGRKNTKINQEKSDEAEMRLKRRHAIS